MSEAEDAAVTLLRLLRNGLRVIRDDGALARVSVTSEWQNAEAFKGCDGQVTVGLAECTDQKIDLSGKTRRRTSFLRVNVWAADYAGASEAGRAMRNKIVEEVNRVIRQNRSKPNETRYDFYNAASQAHKAYYGKGEVSPYDFGWTELSSAQIQQLWYSDDNRCQVSRSENGEFAALLFRFKLESREQTVKKLVLSFEGYGAAPAGNGVAIQVWNQEAAAWQHMQVGGAAGEDETLTLTLTADLPNFIDNDGYVWLLARTRYASNGSVPAVLYCDYVSCTATVNGISYCDVVGYRTLDRLDAKPIIYRTEITVKSWFIEKLGV